MISSEEITAKLYALSDAFQIYISEKNWKRAKGIYDMCRTVAVFVKLDEKQMIELFGDRSDPENPKVGRFNEEDVQKAYLQCIKTNQTNEKREYSSLRTKK